MGMVLNDVHSRLNPTEVSSVVTPASEEEVRAIVAGARIAGARISVSGGRHCMGGQQFGAGTVHVDGRRLREVRAFDPDRGLMEIGAGATWPAIIEATHEAQPGDGKRWGIRQKQTGADDLTLGGAISANAHGRGLLMGPLVDDIEDLTIVTPSGVIVRASRTERPELFSLAVGGYGLFGIVVRATLRLGPRRKLRRRVEVVDIDEAMGAVCRRIDDGCLYGDFQYAIDPGDDTFLRRGVFTCYEPVPAATPLGDPDADLTREDWLRLLSLAHTDKAGAFRAYAQHYLDTRGHVYWSDTMQRSTYIPSYSEFLAESIGREGPESLMITELFVPPAALLDFMKRARAVLRESAVEDIYGTIRAIRPDATTYLPWACGDRACVIFNLRTPHSPEGIDRTRRAARGLIDSALDGGGTFFLAYHRWATREQLLRGHPRLPEFLAAKRRHDPGDLFISEWLRGVRSTLEPLTS
ncbi:MAG: FAD-binding oxidoreductase [Planctomycetes bacterium]|nr:FAD-binding oxidoreductase [Planctomycetota bacterium]